MKNKLLRIGVWVLIWVVFSVVLVNYLPQHPHVKYEILLSPLILLFALFYPLELITGPFPSELAPGILFWIVVFVLLYFPRTKNKNKS